MHEQVIIQQMTQPYDMNMDNISLKYMSLIEFDYKS